MNETNEMWREYRADVVLPMRARRIAQARHDASALGVTVRVLEEVAHHWRCSTTTGKTFDYWPTTRTACVCGAYHKGVRFRDAVAMVEAA